MIIKKKNKVLSEIMHVCVGISHVAHIISEWTTAHGRSNRYKKQLEENKMQSQNNSTRGVRQGGVKEKETVVKGPLNSRDLIVPF